MTAQVVHFSASAHRTAYELLPWLVNGTLDADELASVSAHVRECARCRREIEFLEEVRCACAKEEPAPDAGRAFRRLSAHLDKPRSWRRLGELVTRLAGSWLDAPRWVRSAIAAQVVVLVAASVLIDTIAMDRPVLYHTLSSGMTPSGTMRSLVVKFRSDAADAAVQRALNAARVRVVAGPTQARVYVLEALTDSPEAADTALGLLRADASVELAERLWSRTLP